MDFLLANTKCDVQAIYMKSPQDTICVWQHSPRLKKIQGRVVIICPPMGYEYTHSYRSLRRLADYLCTQGYIVFRFDYFGTGNSSGSILSDDCLQHWVGDISCLSDAVKERFSDFKQCWIGLRLGGTLAALAAKNKAVDELVLWDPIIKGRSYIRELEAISFLSSAGQDASHCHLESAGFILSKQAAEEIKKINLVNDIDIFSETKVFQLSRDDKPVNDSLTDRLQEQGINVYVQVVDGYDEMMAEPHDTIVPVNTIKYISKWLEQYSKKIEKDLPGWLSNERVLNLELDDKKITEQPLFYGNNDSLFGILSKPVNENNKSSHCIILANSGSVHHVGPNSIYTLMSRALTGLGYCVFRIDLGNMGDSQIMDVDFENHPYQPRAVDNIRTTIDFLNKNTSADKFILGGICSGGYTAFHAGLELLDLNVSEVLIINPLTFYWDPGMSLETPSSLQVFRDHVYYKESLRSIEKWKKIFTGKANILYIGQFVFRRGLEFIQKLGRNVRSLVLGENTPLALDFKRFNKNKILINFIFSSTDPGLDIINSQASGTLKKGIKENWIDIHVIDNADHTFSKKSARDNLLVVLCEHYR